MDSHIKIVKETVNELGSAFGCFVSWLGHPGLGSGFRGDEQKMLLTKDYYEGPKALAFVIQHAEELGMNKEEIQLVQTLFEEAARIVNTSNDPKEIEEHYLRVQQWLEGFRSRLGAQIHEYEYRLHAESLDLEGKQLREIMDDPELSIPLSQAYHWFKVSFEQEKWFQEVVAALKQGAAVPKLTTTGEMNTVVPITMASNGQSEKDIDLRELVTDESKRKANDWLQQYRAVDKRNIQSKDIDVFIEGTEVMKLAHEYWKRRVKRLIRMASSSG